MDNRNSLAKDLLNRKINCQAYFDGIQKRLIQADKEIERQRNLAQNGKKNSLASEEANKVKLILVSLEAEENLNNVLIEIETIKLSSDLKNITDVKESSTITEKSTDRYSFHPHLDELRERENVYQLQQQMFNMHGCYKINNAKIYNIDLSILFQYKDVKLCNLEYETSEIVNGMDYLWSFLEGYKEGEKKINPNEDTIYGVNADSYIADIHNSYFHTKIGISFTGWSYVKRIRILSFTHEEIRQYGYYSGIVSKVDDMVIRYKSQFEKFEKCSHGSLKNKSTTNSQNKFIFFEKYFAEHNNLIVYKKHFINEFTTPTSKYFQAIKEYEKAVKQASGDFIDEIRNNIVEFETKSKIKLYLEQIQSKLNLIYEYHESEFTNKHITFDSTIPSLQNLIRDIALKNEIQIKGDEILNPKQKELKIDFSINLIKTDYNTQLFKSYKAFQLFEAWHKEMFSKNKHLADYSYVIRQMLVDKLLYDTTQRVVFDFLATYDIHLTKIKTLSNSKTTTKESLYFKLKEHL